MQSQNQSRYQHSIKLYEQACRWLAGGVSSNFRLGGKPVPLFFERAAGAMLYDADGNEYIDYALGMGPSILGHAPEPVIRAVAATLAQGQLFAGQHATEVTVAQRLCELVPCAERVRLGMSGSEADQAALRLARAYTGKRKIIKFEGHYHGWFDNIFASVHPSLQHAGDYFSPATVPASLGQDECSLEHTITLPWNDIEALTHRLERPDGNQIAGIIMEPILCNTCVIVPRPGYLETVRQLCSERNIVLIFDEVITGFRVDLGGAQRLLGVTPDLAVFAKAFGAGFPISCLTGRKDLMDLLGSGQVMHGGTYNSNTVSCAAALATLEVLSSNEGEVYKAMEKLGTELIRGLRTLGKEHGVPLRVQGVGTVFNVWFGGPEEVSQYRDYVLRDVAQQAIFVELMQDRGVRITPRGTWFLSAAHTWRDIERTLEAARNALQALTKIASSI